MLKIDIHDNSKSKIKKEEVPHGEIRDDEKRYVELNLYKIYK
jgi:hypothetical protein